MARIYCDYDKMSRGLLLGLMLAKGERVTSAVIRDKFGVSRAQAKRDMNAIEAALPVDAEVNGAAVTLLLKTHNDPNSGAARGPIAGGPLE